MRSPTGALLCLFAAGAIGAAQPAERSLPIDPARSELRFTISRPGETIDGHAHLFSGEVRFDPGHPEAGGSVTLTVRADSLETGNRVRDRKMRGSHLEVERFPEIGFRSTSIRFSEAGSVTPAAETRGVETSAVEASAAGGAPRRALVEGIVTLHGVERTLLFPVMIRYDNDSLGAEGEFAIRLTDHAIAIPRFLWIVLDDEVKVHFRFVAAPEPGAAAAGSPRPPG